jgi:hypothetical protein
MPEAPDYLENIVETLPGRWVYAARGKFRAFYVHEDNPAEGLKIELRYFGPLRPSVSHDMWNLYETEALNMFELVGSKKLDFRVPSEAKRLFVMPKEVVQTSKFGAALRVPSVLDTDGSLSRTYESLSPVERDAVHEPYAVLESCLRDDLQLRNELNEQNIRVQRLGSGVNIVVVDLKPVIREIIGMPTH